MANISSVFFAFLAFVAVVLCTPEYVRELDPDSLNNFYAPWCGHCNNMNPAYQRLGSYFGGDGRVTIAQIDADHYARIRRPYNIGGYPTLKLFHPSGRVEDADCGHDFESMKRFVESRIRCGHCKRLAPIYKKLATSFKDNTNVVIAQIDCESHAAIATQHKVDAFPTIKLFGRDNKVIDYNGSNSLKGLLEFVKKHSPKEWADIHSKDYGTDRTMDKYVREFFTNPDYHERVYEQAGELARSTKDLYPYHMAME
ncbi:hypothetical protein PSACC_01819 [Paramicrosporidium saccamoebae]|uniref:Thioredoxin domain-containing protein n=1 Tax=Paramicrosporidium saccamoebae TaxID=1246581 RepID=A0A2H9TKY0_9FUNG|nr:hypothetical protein PSACC_01819 [Paramicrosporidium saccamoebae]